MVGTTRTYANVIQAVRGVHLKYLWRLVFMSTEYQLANILP